MGLKEKELREKIAAGELIESSEFPKYYRSNKAATGGKQKKDPLSGFYYDIHGNGYYIKRSATKPADDINEILASRLGDIVAPEKFAACAPIFFNGKLYVRSTLAGEKDLRTPQGLTSEVYAKGREEIYQILTQSHIPDAKQRTAEILICCILMREFDCHAGNIRDNIKKIDHGWAFDGIISNQENLLADFFNPRMVQMLFKKPTNHFKDFPLITGDVALMANAIESVVGKFNVNKIEMAIKNTFDDIKAGYPNDENPELFKAHMQQVATRFGSQKRFTTNAALASELANALNNRNNGLKKLYKKVTGKKLVSLQNCSKSYLNTKIMQQAKEVSNLALLKFLAKKHENPRRIFFMNYWERRKIYNNIKALAGNEWRDMESLLPSNSSKTEKIQKIQERLEWQIQHDVKQIESLQQKFKTSPEKISREIRTSNTRYKSKGRKMLFHSEADRHTLSKQFTSEASTKILSSRGRARVPNMPRRR